MSCFRPLLPSLESASLTGSWGLLAAPPGLEATPPEAIAALRSGHLGCGRLHWGAEASGDHPGGLQLAGPLWPSPRIGGGGFCAQATSERSCGLLQLKSSSHHASLSSKITAAGPTCCGRLNRVSCPLGSKMHARRVRVYVCSSLFPQVDVNKMSTGKGYLFRASCKGGTISCVWQGRKGRQRSRKV